VVKNSQREAKFGAATYLVGILQLVALVMFCSMRRLGWLFERLFEPQADEAGEAKISIRKP